MSIPALTLSAQQDRALRAVGGWIKAKPGNRGTPLAFRLFGYAGTGKTTLARHLAVVLFDEASVFGADCNRWLYTGITRAANRITVVLS
jgi:hypothetical protein